VILHRFCYRQCSKRVQFGMFLTWPKAPLPSSSPSTYLSLKADFEDFPLAMEGEDVSDVVRRLPGSYPLAGPPPCLAMDLASRLLHGA